MDYKIRKAKIRDVKSIQKLINYYAGKRIMLPRALNQIYDNIQGFCVVEHKRKVVGCCAVTVSWEDLAEIKSLAVSPEFKKKGLGKKLVEMCENEAESLGVKKVFVLTYVPGFFRKLGYKNIPKQSLPHKIWTECIQCAFFPNCKEVPLLKHI